MEDKPSARKSRNHHPERITLSPEALSRVSAWLEQIRPNLKGTSLSRGELVSWIIVQRANSLTEIETSGIAARFFDPVKAMLWAANHIREKQKTGETVDIATLLKDTLTKDVRSSKKRLCKAKEKISTKAPLQLPTGNEEI